MIESRDPFLRVSMVSSLVSVWKATDVGHSLETFNVAKKWLSKTSIIQRVSCLSYLHFAGQKQPNTGRKNSRNLKKIQLRSDDNIFLKNFGKIHKFSSLGIFDEVSVSTTSFRPTADNWNINWLHLKILTCHHCYIRLVAKLKFIRAK